MCIKNCQIQLLFILLLSQLIRFIYLIFSAVIPQNEFCYGTARQYVTKDNASETSNASNIQQSNQVESNQCDRNKDTSKSVLQ